MKRLLKSWVFWAFVVPPVVAALSYGVLRRDDILNCACGSGREQSRLWVGIPDGPGLPFFPLGSSERPSPIFTEILGAAHDHAWRESNSHSFSLWGRYGGPGCILRAPVPNVAYFYAYRPPFRDWLKGKVERGEIAPAAVAADLVKNPFYPRDRYPFGWTPPP